MPKVDLKMSTFADAEGRLAESLKGYEPRSQQTALAEAVEQAIANRTHLLAEAGTGTGKSFATLIPAILSGQRVIISTATKALQDQLAFKDIPFLQDNLGVEFTATVLKGRRNYLCLNRLNFSDSITDDLRAKVLDVVAKLEQPDGSFTGERDQLGFEISHGEWMEIASESDECGDCGPTECFAQRARDSARLSQIVVVNHALYMTELMVKDKSDGFANFLGKHSYVVFDEAHNIEDYAASALSDQLNIYGIENAMGEVVNVTGSYDRDRTSQARDLTAAVMTPAKALWATFEPGRLRSKHVLDNADLYVELTNALFDLEAFMAEKWPLTAALSSGTEKIRGSRARRRVLNLYNIMEKVVTEDFSTTLRFIEERETLKKGQKRLDLKYGPIDVSGELRRLLFGDTGVTAILVSATLATNGKFDYIAGRLGVDHFDELDVGTPFDYQNQAVFYVPDDLPDPRDDAWSSLSIQRMRDLIKLSDGRALLLFTSIKEMRLAYDTISGLVPHNCFIQYSEPNQVLAKKFREDTHSILFATKSFMEGVDFQGDTLKLVIVNKMPFPVPSEPITEARIENIEAKGGNSFFEYMVPVMTLTLKQAVGRLIRNKTDSGVYAILDPRILKKGYGKGLVKSLPDAPLTSDLGVVEGMYS